MEEDFVARTRFEVPSGASRAGTYPFKSARPNQPLPADYFSSDFVSRTEPAPCPCKLNEHLQRVRFKVGKGKRLTLASHFAKDVSLDLLHAEETLHLNDHGSPVELGTIWINGKNLVSTPHRADASHERADMEILRQMRARQMNMEEFPEMFDDSLNDFRLTFVLNFGGLTAWDGLEIRESTFEAVRTFSEYVTARNQTVVISLPRVFLADKDWRELVADSDPSLETSDVPRLVDVRSGTNAPPVSTNKNDQVERLAQGAPKLLREPAKILLNTNSYSLHKLA